MHRLNNEKGKARPLGRPGTAHRPGLRARPVRGGMARYFSVQRVRAAAGAGDALPVSEGRVHSEGHTKNPQVHHYDRGLDDYLRAALLYFAVDGDFSMLAPTSTFGVSISGGMAFALIAFVLGLAVTTPNFRKIVRIVKEMGEKGAQEPPTDLGKYLARSRILGTTNVLLLLVALAFMVTAGFY